MAARFRHHFFSIRDPLPSATILMQVYSASFLRAYQDDCESICRDRTSLKFTFHIPELLKRLLAKVLDLPTTDRNRREKITLINSLVLETLAEYEKKLISIIITPGVAAKYCGINASTLDAYEKQVNSIKRFIQRVIDIEETPSEDIADDFQLSSSCAMKGA